MTRYGCAEKPGRKPVILSRFTKHVKDQNWFAVGLDFLIVVVGVYIGVWVSGYQERASLHSKQAQVVETLRLDMEKIHEIDTDFAMQMRQGLAEWGEKRASGAVIPPYFLRIPGSDTAPQNVWSSLPPNQLTEMFAPDLLYDLGFYYSELAGVGRKYLRYVVFVENEILPGLKQYPSYFYREDGLRLKPKFEANMDRLQDWIDENTRLRAWSACLTNRLETPMQPGKSCMPELTAPVITNPDIKVETPKEKP